LVELIDEADWEAQDNERCTPIFSVTPLTINTNQGDLKRGPGNSQVLGFEQKRQYPPLRSLEPNPFLPGLFLRFPANNRISLSKRSESQLADKT
jgi:hypothetical protein